MKIKQTVGTETEERLRNKAWTFRKAAKLLAMNWEPTSVVNYLMHELVLDRQHATNIVDKVRFAA